MYTPSSILAKSKNNQIYGKVSNNSKNYYRNVYLQSDHWRNLRKEKLELTPRCEICKTTLSLDVHHKSYHNLYDVLIKDLQTLCRRCHTREHTKKDKKKEKKLKLRFCPENSGYNILYRIFRSPTPNFLLIKYILNYLICELEFINRPKKLNNFNKSKIKKFDKKYKTIPHDMNTYISIHY